MRSNPGTSSFLQVSTATESRAIAEELARMIVEAKLAAGAQIIGPVISAYWHLGQFGTGEEWQLLLKTHSDRYGELERTLRQHHPWANPEIVAIPLVVGSATYFAWLAETLSIADVNT